MNPTTLITSSNARLSEKSPWLWTAEASDLGFAPGVWPRSLATSLGSLQAFVLVDLDENAATYRQEGSQLLLQIFND